MTDDHDDFERVQENIESMHVNIHSDVGAAEVDKLENVGLVPVAFHWLVLAVCLEHPVHTIFVVP